MRTWLAHMPKGMRLKSEGFASSLYDPDSTFTLESYCKDHGIPYAKTGLPVPLEVFASYGLEFQRRFVPELDTKLVSSLQRSAEGFCIRLDDGKLVSARRVVMAIGIIPYDYLPPVLAALPEGFATHSSRHHSLDRFKGREVAVVGAGASALDLAALLHESGARPHVVARRAVIHFHSQPSKREPSFLDVLRAPVTPIGPGWKLFLCANAPLLFRAMPEKFRLEKVRRVLGPAACWFVKEQIVGKVPIIPGVTVTEAKVQTGRVSLRLTDGAGVHTTLITDHVISATGYKVDIERLTFVDPNLRAGIQSVDSTPVLSAHFESSVPGLYFVGASAANTFGPLLRFACGALFTARRLSRHLAKSHSREALSSESKVSISSSDGENVSVANLS